MTAFSDRHIGPSIDDEARMLSAVGFSDLDGLIAAAVPATIRTDRPLDLPAALSEPAALARLRELAAGNAVRTSLIGLGYYGTITPGVILRNVMENPGWYTAYTPYQPEISQGRLEALLNYQTVVSDLTGLAVANASMLDEGTAAAEALALAHRASRLTVPGTFVIDADALPQTIEVVKARALPLGVEIIVADLDAGLPEGEFFGVLAQYPGASGKIRDLQPLIEAAHRRGATFVAAADLLALTVLTPPGELGADIAVGSAQRFGVPFGFGGPHAGYLAVGEDLQRQLPGRLVGVSVDADGHPAYRLALQTREQHIRREKATSNICTAQVLLAVMAGMYAVYHGPDGLTEIARRVHDRATAFAGTIRELAVDGLEIVHEHFFDTVTVRVPSSAQSVRDSTAQAGFNIRVVDEQTVSVSFDETTTEEHLLSLAEAVDPRSFRRAVAVAEPAEAIPAHLRRESVFLTHPVFHSHRSETSMLRYLRRLQDKDIALDRSMIPLGSCTMKLNA
ncbi:MAG: glycine dehydrogenase (aminomethyl-transferring), partial [Streptosporangiaceae bacterium]